MDFIKRALTEGRSVLSEYEAKELFRQYSVPVARGEIVAGRDELVAAADRIGYPVVIKACSYQITHKTEEGLVITGIRDETEIIHAFEELTDRLKGKSYNILVEEMVDGKREVMVGLIRDPQFGPCVMFGLGGIFTEVLKDVSFRLAPLRREDAIEMMGEIKGHRILDAIRGMQAADRNRLADLIVNIGRVGVEHKEIMEIDVNPVIISGTDPVAVDALITLCVENGQERCDG